MATVKKLISLDENISKELENVADALDFYFDYTDTVVADKVTREINSGNMEVYDSEEVYKELGIEL